MKNLFFPTIMEAEDMFAPAFSSGITGWQVSMDSYMAVMSYDIVDKIYLENKDKYTRKVWSDLVEYWLSMGYVSPMCKLLGLTIKRKLETNEKQL
jgi:hypothetical protein